MNPARGLIDGAGLGPLYNELWWRSAGRGKARLTDWNRRRGALFVHVPKAAGLSLYAGLGMDRPADSHAPASAWARSDPDFFASAYKFAVARNPWDRAVSAFHYLKHSTEYRQDRRWAERRLAGVDDFAGFLAALRRPWFRNQALAWRHFAPQSSFVEIGGRLAVDRLIRFERLDEEIAEVAARIGAVYRPRRLNGSERGDYRRYYDDDGAALIAEIYAADLRLTGASFDPVKG